MFGIENYLGFILAAILLNLTPGTDSMYIITRSISQGQTAGFYSVLGITSGILVHTLLAALGLSVLLANSPTAFMIVKYIGAAYLCYLGLKMLLSKNSSSIANNLSKDQNVTSRKAVDGWQIYKQGVLTNTFNPKVDFWIKSIGQHTLLIYLPTIYSLSASHVLIFGQIVCYRARVFAQ